MIEQDKTIIKQNFIRRSSLNSIGYFRLSKSTCKILFWNRSILQDQPKDYSDSFVYGNRLDQVQQSQRFYFTNLILLKKV